MEERNVDAVVKLQVNYGESIKKMFNEFDKYFEELEKKYKDSPMGTTIEAMQNQIKELRKDLTTTTQEVVRKSTFEKWQADMTSSLKGIEETVNEVSEKTGGKIPEALMQGLDEAKKQYIETVAVFQRYINAAKSVRELGNIEFRAVKVKDIEYSADQIQEFYEILQALSKNTVRPVLLDEMVASGKSITGIFDELNSKLREYTIVVTQNEDVNDDISKQYYLRALEIYNAMQKIAALDPSKLGERMRAVTQALSFGTKDYFGMTIRDMQKVQRELSQIVGNGEFVKDTRATVEAFNLSEDGQIKVFAKIATSAEDLKNQLAPIINEVQQFANEKLVKLTIDYGGKEKPERAVSKSETVEQEVIKKVAQKVTAIDVGLNISPETISAFQNKLNEIDLATLQDKVSGLFNQEALNSWASKFSEEIKRLSGEVGDFQTKLKEIGTIQVKPEFQVDEGQKANINELFSENTVTVLRSMDTILTRLIEIGSNNKATQVDSTVTSLSTFISTAKENADGVTKFLDAFTSLQNASPAKDFIKELNTLSGSAGLGTVVSVFEKLGTLFVDANGKTVNMDSVNTFFDKASQFKGNENINTFLGSLQSAGSAVSGAGLTEAFGALETLFSTADGKTIDAESINTFIQSTKDYKKAEGLEEVIGSIRDAATNITDGTGIKNAFDAISTFAAVVEGKDINATGITTFVKELISGSPAEGLAAAFEGIQNVIRAIDGTQSLNGTLTTLLRFEEALGENNGTTLVSDLRTNLNGIAPADGALEFINALSSTVASISGANVNAPLDALREFATGVRRSANGRTQQTDFSSVTRFLGALRDAVAEFGSATFGEGGEADALQMFLAAFTEFSGNLSNSALRLTNFVTSITDLSRAMRAFNSDSLANLQLFIEKVDKLQEIAYRNTATAGLTDFVRAFRELGEVAATITAPEGFQEFVRQVSSILTLKMSDSKPESLNAILQTVRGLSDVNDHIRNIEVVGQNGAVTRFTRFVEQIQNITNAFSSVRNNLNVDSISRFVSETARAIQPFNNAAGFTGFTTEVIRLIPALSGADFNEWSINSFAAGLERIIAAAQGATRYANLSHIVDAVIRLIPPVNSLTGPGNFTAFTAELIRITNAAQGLEGANGFANFTTFINSLVTSANAVTNTDAFNALVRNIISLFAVGRNLNNDASENLYKGALAVGEFARIGRETTNIDSFVSLVTSINSLIEALQWLTNVGQFVEFSVAFDKIAKAAGSVSDYSNLITFARAIESFVYLAGLAADPTNLNNLVYVFQGFATASKDVKDPDKVVALVRALGDLVYASEFMTDNGSSLTGVFEGIAKLAQLEGIVKNIQNLKSVIDPIRELISDSQTIGDPEALRTFVEILGELADIGRSVDNVQGFTNLLKAITSFTFQGEQAAGLEEFKKGFTAIANTLIQKRYDPRILLQTANAINQFHPRADLGAQLSQIGIGLGAIVENTKEIPDTFKEFSDSLTNILQYGEALRDLSRIMQKPMEKLKEVQRTISNTTAMKVNIPSMEKQISQFESVTNGTENYNKAVQRLRATWNDFNTKYAGGEVVPNEDLVLAQNQLSDIKKQITSLYTLRNKYTGLIDLGFDKTKMQEGLEALKKSTDQTTTYRQKLTELEEKIRSVVNTYGNLTHFTDEDKTVVGKLTSEINSLFKQLQDGKFNGVSVSSLKLFDDKSIDNTIRKFEELGGQSKEYGEQITALKNKVDEFKSLTKGGLIDNNKETIDRVKTLNTEIKQLLKTLETNKAYTTTTRGVRTTITSVEELRDKILETDKSAKNLEIVENRVGRITATFKNANGQIEKLTYNVDKASGAFVLMGRSVSGDALTRLRDTLEAVGKNFMYYFSGRMLFYRAVSGVKSGVEVVKELNTQLTEMRKVSDETLGTLKNYVNTSFEMAKAVGSTSTAILSSTADYMRLGKTLAQASELAQHTAILLNVSEFEDVSEATDAMISMTQAYQDLTSMEVIDRLNYAGKLLPEPMVI